MHSLPLDPPPAPPKNLSRTSVDTCHRHVKTIVIKYIGTGKGNLERRILMLLSFCEHVLNFIDNLIISRKNVAQFLH